MDDNKGVAPPGDQEKFNILPYERNLFFSKQFPIELVFYLNDDEKVIKLIAHQNGEHEAKKIICVSKITNVNLILIYPFIKE